MSRSETYLVEGVEYTLTRNEDWSGDAFIREQNTPETGLSQGIRVPGKLLLAIARRTIIGDFGDQEP